VDVTDPSAAACACLTLLAALAVGCGGAKADAPAPGVSVALSAASSPVDFAFDSLDDRAVSAQTTRGKPTVITFVTTSNLPSQAQVDFLVAMARNDGELVHYAVVAVEPPDARELVELYRRGLATPFPVAMADSATLAGDGPFGDVTAVPVTVVLDRAGRVAWRADGRVARSDELRRVLRAM
jgi:hypothetical protein